MHEVSLVRNLLQRVQQLCDLHKGTSIEQIDIEIGPLSGVETLLVSEAFQVVAPATHCGGAALVIHEVPLTACCQDCAAESILEKFNFICQSCGSRSLRIAGGDQFRLLSVTIQTNQPTQTMPRLVESRVQS